MIDELSNMRSDNDKFKIMIIEKKVYDVPDTIGEKIFDIITSWHLMDALKGCRPFAESIKAEKFEDKVFFRYNKQSGVSGKINAEQLKNESGYWNNPESPWFDKNFPQYDENFCFYIDSSSVGDSYEKDDHIYCCVSLGNFDI